MTTTVRSVRVEMDLAVSRYVANARLVGRETDAMGDRIEHRIGAADRAVSGLDKSTSHLSRTTADARVQQTAFGRDIDKTSVALGRGERSIDKYSGRLGLLLNLAAGIGPALIPIAAVGIPAVAGLTSELGFAAAAGGSAVLALHGVGDSLKLIEKARLDPTVENLRAADDAVRRLAPDAQTLVHHLEDLASTGRGLQRTAAGGFIPGLDDAITSLETRIPEVRRLIAEVSDAAGDNLRDAGESLASDRWTFFFDYLRTQARPQLDATADSVGNLAHGFAQLIVATTGLQGDFAGFLRSSTESFDQWASRLSRSTEFHEFIAYVRDNGPQVAATAEEIADAILQIVEAAAPLGGPTLQVLESVASILGAIADSDVGTPLLTLLSLTSAYSLAARPLKALNESAWGGRQVSNLKGFGAALTTVVTAQDRARMSAAQMVMTEERRSKAVRSGLATLGKGAALAGLFGVAASGVADKVGLANTATLTLAGSMAGPWGAAAGAGVGLLLDWSHRSDGAKEAASEFTATLDQQTGVLTDNTRALAIKKLADSGALDAARDLGLSLQVVTDAALGNEDAQTRLNAALAGYDQITAAAGTRAGATAGRNAQAAAAARLLGDTVGDVSGAVATSRDQFNLQAAAMGGTTHRTNDLRAAYDRAASAADNLTGEISELEGLLNKRATLRNYQASLDDLRKSLKDAPHAFSELGEAGRTNLGNLDTVIHNASERLKALTDPHQKAAFLKDVFDQLHTIAKTSPEAAAAVRKVLPALQEVRDANKTVLMRADNADVMKKSLEAKLALREVHTIHPRPVITVDPGNSFGILDAIKARLGSLHDRTISVTTIQHSVGGGAVPRDSLAGGKPKAEGGTVEGPRYPYGDKVLIAAAPGEEVISNRHGQADRFRADRALGRIPGYADGGTVEDRVRSTYTSRYRGTAGDSFHEVTEGFHVVADAAGGAGRGLKGLEKAADKVRASYEKEKSKLDDLISRRDSLASSITSAAQHDVFNTSFESRDPITGEVTHQGGLAGFDAQLEADTADIDAMTAALATLVKNGLDPKSALYQQLAASMDVSTAQQLAALSAGDLALRAQRFQHRADDAAALGGTVAGQEFNAAVRDQTKATRELRQELHRLRDSIHDLKDLPEHVKDGAYHGTVEGSREGAESGTRAGQEEKRSRTAAMIRTGGLR